MLQQAGSSLGARAFRCGGAGVPIAHSTAPLHHHVTRSSCCSTLAAVACRPIVKPFTWLQLWLSIEWEEEARARTQRLRDDCIAGSTRELGKGFHRCSATEKSQQKALHRSTRRTPKRSHFKQARESTQASIGNSHVRLQRRLKRNKLMGERSVILLSASEPRPETARSAAAAAAAAAAARVAAGHAEQTGRGRRQGGGDKPLAVLMGCRPKKALRCSTSFPPVERVRLHARRGGQLQHLRTSVVNSEVQNLSTWRLCSSTVSRRRENM